MNKVSLLLVLALAIGCGGPKELTKQDLDDMKAKVTVGMSYRQVLDTIGTPEADNYLDTDKGGFISYISKDRTEVLNVRFLEGKVTEVIRLGPADIQ